MKVRHFHSEVQKTSNRPSLLLINLRHEKIAINHLLRWTSVGLLAAYLLTFVAGVQTSNQMSSSYTWISLLIIIVLISLFVSLLYIQYYYSEKRLESIAVEPPAFKLHSLNGKSQYRRLRLYVIVYVSMSLASGLSCVNLVSSEQFEVTCVAMLTGLLLYGLGLLQMRNLLKQKCAAWITINKKLS